ncbi:MAG TPA: alpha/beta hydrolase [Burkholderiaceae bacterium]|nr:alpha/beta hydrolase [Burkholderiaceae bacterium]
MQELPPQIHELLKSATQTHTPCGSGSVVWHSWGSGAPVVLLHGGSGSWTHWLRNIQALVDAGRQVLVPDLPGFGDSALPPGSHDADGVPAPLAEGLQLLLGDARCDVVGFSFGAMAAGLLCADHPERAARLVIVGAPALGVVPKRLVDLKGWRHFKDPARQDAAHRHNLAVLMLHDANGIDDETLALHKANVVRDRMPGRRLAYTDLLAQALRRVACPVHAIYGQEDALYRGYMPALVAALPQGTGDFRGLRQIPGAGHWVQYECADAFNAALAQALAA